MLAALLFAAPSRSHAQRPMDATPNTRAPWTMAPGQPALLLSHRFEFIGGGDELLNVPLIVVGTAVTERIAIGLDFTSNSEVTAESFGGNERQWWVAYRALSGTRLGLSTLLAYNSAARSVDVAATTTTRSGRITLVAEARGFSDAFGTGAAGVAASGGASFALTPYLSVGGDLGRTFSPDTFGTVWTGGITLAIPGTRHQFAFHASNGGAPTLQGASRTKVIGPQPRRYGFTFIAPLGSAAQWRRVFRPGDDDPSVGEARASDTVRVRVRDLAFKADTVHIRVGQWVEWINDDPVPHTVADPGGAWRSGFLMAEQRYLRRFTTPGRFEYVCEPHPHMKGLVIVTP